MKYNGIDGNKAMTIIRLKIFINIALHYNWVNKIDKSNKYK
jgi:hypothetical protein